MTITPAVTLATLIATAGCAPQPTPTPAPVPTYRCTPEAGGPEDECNQLDYDQMKAKDALYVEAEQVYRNLWRERDRLFRTGAPADEAALAFTQGHGSETLVRAHSRGTRHIGGTLAIVWIERTPGLSRDGSLVTLTVCIDTSTTTVVQDGKSYGPGSLAHERAYFGGTPGSLRVVYNEYKKVETCIR